MPNLVIRLINALDAERLRDHRAQIGRETDFLQMSGNEFAAQTLEDVQQWIGAIDRQAHSLWLVAEDQGKIVGELFLEGFPYSRLSHKVVLFIAVQQSHWGKGLAARLLREGEKWCHDNQVSLIQLSVFATNTRAIAFYKKQKFVDDGVRAKSFKVNGALVDEVFMRKEL